MITQEADILNAEVRKKVIAFINSGPNVDRKRQQLRSYEIYKDMSKKYVAQALEREMEAKTLEEMQSRASNISILRKIINKKARVYKNGAMRPIEKEELSETEAEVQQKAADSLYDLLNFNREMKKANRYLELQKNTAIQILPVPNEDGLHNLKARAYPGHLYDIIEDPNDPESAMVYIFSTFSNSDETHDAVINNGRGIANKQEKDAEEIVDNTEYIWWSKTFHFTTDAKGSIIAEKSPDNNLNPVGIQTICSLNKDQDGSYWAVGGEDLIDGSVLINVLLTDLYFIAKIQGMGQFYMFGKNVPKNIKVGPNHAITLEVEEGDPTPSIGFASSNPPLQDHMKMIEQYIALLLSTNDLASSAIQGDLQANTASSGIQELIVRSEVTTAIEDEQQIFLDAEPKLWEIIKAWQNFYMDNNKLTDEFKEIGKVAKETKIMVNFLPFQEFMTEEQRLNIIEKRQELGLDTQLDLIKRDNPDMSDTEADEKLQGILKEKLEKASMFMLENKEAEDEEIPKDGEQGNKEN